MFAQATLARALDELGEWQTQQEASGDTEQTCRRPARVLNAPRRVESEIRGGTGIRDLRKSFR